MNIIQYLRDKGVEFEVLPHEESCDAMHLAEAVHAPGKCVAKCVLTQADHGYRSFVVIVPSTHRIDFSRLKSCCGGGEFELATEEGITQHFPDCQVGVVPPFGSLYGVGTIVDRRVGENEKIIFDANNHREAVRLSYSDFVRLENPLVGDFAESWT